MLIWNKYVAILQFFLLIANSIQHICLQLQMHTVGFVDAEDMNLRKRKYRSWLGYSNSKLAQVPYLLLIATRILFPFLLIANLYMHACYFMLVRSELFFVSLSDKI
jgi:hypothetical protein